MSKVVLLAVNAKYVHSSLSVWVIAEGVVRYSLLPHDVNVVEATINQPVDEVAELVLVHNPDVIGISSYIWNAAVLPELLDLLRQRMPDAVLVLGGPEASNNEDHWLKRGADYVLHGEGEYRFPQFLDALAEGGSGDRVCDAEAAIAASYNEPVDPYTKNYFSALGSRLSYIEASRGCPFQCSFCLSAGSEVRYFPLDTVKRQILTLSRSNTKTVKFVDRTFNCNADRAYEIFEYVIGLDTSCRFHFEAAADLFDEPVLLLLETAPPGRIQFEIGLQSFYAPALKASCRQIDITQAERVIRLLQRLQNIHIHIDLIAGLPHEALADFADGFDRAYSLDTHVLQLGFLKLLHGSVLREQADALKIQYSPEPPYEILQSPWLSEKDIQLLKKAENALQHTRNKGRFLSVLYYVLTSTGKRPFSFFSELGAAVPNHGTQLEDYAVQIFDFCVKLPGVDKNALQDCLTYDWLGMVKGKNTPPFLKNESVHRKRVAEIAEKTLGHKVRREEFAVLQSGKGIFVDRSNQDPVTGLYRIYICE